MNAISKTGGVNVCSVPEVDETFTDETTGLNFKIISVSEGSKSVELEQYAEGSPYSGDVVIPEIIIYKGEIFHVTKIAANAFAQCIGLTSIEFKSNDCENGIATNAFEGVGSESNPCNLILPESWKKEYAELLENGVKKFYEQNNIDSTAHQFRHSFASMLHDAEIDAKDAQAILGHAQISTTMDIYPQELSLLMLHPESISSRMVSSNQSSSWLPGNM